VEDGVLVFLNSGNWAKGESVRIYDESGNIWYEAPFTLPGFQYSKDAGPNTIHPLAIERGDFSPEFRCAGVSTNWYEVVVDELTSPKTKKFIRRSDPLFVFKTWSDYYENAGIAFRYKETQVFREPYGDILHIVPSNAPEVRGIKVNGDWLQITWKEGSYKSQPADSGNADQSRTGWIRWRDGEKILVSLAWD
jgi:hypothetical protein